MSDDVDYSKYTCELCGTKGVTEEGMDVFVALLCQECFDKSWTGYVKAVSIE